MENDKWRDECDNFEKKHSHFEVIKSAETYPEMDFDLWVQYLILRLCTRGWRFSFTISEDKQGLLINFSFPMYVKTFRNKLGAAALKNIFTIRHHTGITYPDPIHDWNLRTHFLLIKDEKSSDFDNWIDSIDEIFLKLGWKSNNLQITKKQQPWKDDTVKVYGFHQVIRNVNKEPVGIVVTFGFVLTFDKFYSTMEEENLRFFSYISKTTEKMSEDDLNKCYSYGFFEREPEIPREYDEEG